MGALTLDNFREFRRWLMRMRARWLRRVVGVEVDTTLESSMSSRFLPARRGSIVIGTETLVAFKTLIYTRDHATGADRPVRIGSRCFIGGGATITPGVTVGDGSIVGSGAVVFEDVPARSIVAGNPARVIRSEIEVGPFGRLSVAAKNQGRTVTRDVATGARLQED
jgi:serine acetyltransferase